MTYYTKSCPHCRYAYQIHDHRKHRYGSPFRTCKNCKKSFIDTDFIEIGLLPPWKIRNPRVYPGSILILSVGILMALFLWIPGPITNNIVTIAIASIGLLMTISDLRDYQDRSEYILHELKHSKSRLSNPEYVLALYEIGVGIPEDIYNEALHQISRAE